MTARIDQPIERPRGDKPADNTAVEAAARDAYGAPGDRTQQRTQRFEREFEANRTLPNLEILGSRAEVKQETDPVTGDRTINVKGPNGTYRGVFKPNGDFESEYRAANGNVTVTSRRNGVTESTTTRNVNGEPQIVERRLHNSQGITIEKRGNDGSTTVTQIDKSGNRTTTMLDERGRVTRETKVGRDGSRSDTQTSYNDDDKVTSVRKSSVDANGKRSSSTERYDNDGNRVMSRTEDENGVTTHRFNPDGTTTIHNRGKDGSTSIEQRNEDGELMNRVEVKGNTATITNSDNQETKVPMRGRPGSEVELPNGVKAKYDRNGRLQSASYEDNGATETINFKDGKVASRRTEVDDDNGETSVHTEAYDAAGNIVSQKEEKGDTTTETRYRPDGSYTTTTRSPGRVTESVNNANGNQVTERTTNADGSIEVKYFNPEGHLIRERFQSRDGSFQERHYDPNGRVREFDSKTGRWKTITPAPQQFIPDGTRIPA